jgi:exonuclease VII large subunit
MDWSDKVQEMMQSWTRSQQQMWSQWLDGVQSRGPDATFDSWNRTIDTWQESVNNTLDAQFRWMQTWAENLTNAEGSTESVGEWAARSQDGMARWYETQRTLWENWFEILRKSGPDSISHSSQEADQMLEAWKASAQNAIDAQMQVVSTWFKNKPE